MIEREEGAGEFTVAVSLLYLRPKRALTPWPRFLGLGLLLPKFLAMTA